MKQISYDTWLFKESMRMAGTNRRSIKEIANGTSRSREYLSYYFFFTNSWSSLKDENIRKAVNKSFEIKYNKELQKKFFKTIEIWQSFINNKEKKKEVMNINIHYKLLNRISKEVGVRYSNAYRFFVKKDASALKLEDAQRIALILKK